MYLIVLSTTIKKQYQSSFRDLNDQVEADLDAIILFFRLKQVPEDVKRIFVEMGFQMI